MSAPKRARDDDEKLGEKRFMHDGKTYSSVVSAGPSLAFHAIQRFIQGFAEPDAASMMHRMSHSTLANLQSPFDAKKEIYLKGLRHIHAWLKDVESRRLLLTTGGGLHAYSLTYCDPTPFETPFVQISYPLSSVRGFNQAEKFHQDAVQLGIRDEAWKVFLRVNFHLNDQAQADKLVEFRRRVDAVLNDENEHLFADAMMRMERFRDRWITLPGIMNEHSALTFILWMVGMSRRHSWNQFRRIICIFALVYGEAGRVALVWAYGFCTQGWSTMSTHGFISNDATNIWAAFEHGLYFKTFATTVEQANKNYVEHAEAALAETRKHVDRYFASRPGDAARYETLKQRLDEDLAELQGVQRYTEFYIHGTMY